ncbi:MAG: hypothetical protein ACLFV3_07590 [Phycisphaeraceae bacterium]
MIQQHEKYPDMEGSRRAMIRAARRAAEVARQHQQPLVLWRDGRIVRVKPDDLPDLPEQTPETTQPS